METRAAEQPFMRNGPDIPASPVVLSVPHAGRAYSAGLLAASRLPRATLELLEDRLVDKLVWRAVAAGAVAIIARQPRAEIDINRDEREIDPTMVTPAPPAAELIPSPRTRGGLGLVPARIGGAGPIWRQRLAAGELARRIEEIHRPYHAALAAALGAAQARFGAAILLDCHSMPPRAPKAEPTAEIVFGDRHGTSISPDYVEVAIAAAREAGFATAWNAPYAGCYVTSRHGRPASAFHALQIEIDRSLYLDAALREPGPGFERTARMLAAVAAALARQEAVRRHPSVAEDLAEVATPAVGEQHDHDGVGGQLARRLKRRGDGHAARSADQQPLLPREPQGEIE
jgi:N-formylglutamate amidohydrolase